MKLYLPYPKAYITQPFGANANSSYKSQGLKGHTSTDWGAMWGMAVPNCAENAYVYSVMNKDNPDPSKFRAVFTLVEDETGIYEVSYGHLSTITAVVGKTYQPGQTLGLIGNTGLVYSGGVLVSVEARKAGSIAGAHLHGPQVRPVKKVKKVVKGKKYLRDANGNLKKDGFFFEILDYDNGYNGCVAPEYRAMLATEWKPDLTKEKEVIDGLGKAIGIISKLPEKDRGPWLKELTRITGDFLKHLRK